MEHVGTWGTLIRWHRVLMSTSVRAMVWAHCGCFCQLLNKQLSCLCLVIPGPIQPPTPLYTTLVIL